MVRIVNSVPFKKAVMIKIPKEVPVLQGEPGVEKIDYKGFTIPKTLNKKLLKKCDVYVKRSEKGISSEEVEYRVYKKNLKNDMYMRFTDKPTSIVTDAFCEINPNDIVSEVSKITGSKPLIRYFENDESLQFNFPIKSSFRGLNIFVNTQKYGTYGGSGEHALKFGISWFNDVCSNWTIFLQNELSRNKGRILHRGDNTLEEKMSKIASKVEQIHEKIEMSKDKFFNFIDLKTYFDLYTAKGLNKGIMNTILKENPYGMKVYDLSYRLTELCQNPKIADTSRSKIEYLAGEVILCSDKIKGEIDDFWEIRGKTMFLGSSNNKVSLPVQYVYQNKN